MDQELARTLRQQADAEALKLRDDCMKVLKAEYERVAAELNAAKEGKELVKPAEERHEVDAKMMSVEAQYQERLVANAAMEVALLSLAERDAQKIDAASKSQDVEKQMQVAEQIALNDEKIKDTLLTDQAKEREKQLQIIKQERDMREQERQRQEQSRDRDGR